MKIAAEKLKNNIRTASATSGGRTHGKLGFDEMTYPKVLVHDYYTPPARRNIWWHPFTPATYKGVRGACHLFFGNSLTERIGGAFHLMKIFPGMLKR